MVCKDKKKEYHIRQGDEYSIPFTLKAEGKDITDAEKIVINIGKKDYSSEDGYITFNSDRNCYELHLSQKDTFSHVAEIPIPAQIRVKLGTDEVIGKELPMFVFDKSLSGEIL